MSRIVIEDVFGRTVSPSSVPIDDSRGTWGMWLFVSTEATLFVMLFFSYYYVEKGDPQRWTLELLPRLHYSLPNLGIMILGTLLIFWGARQLRKGEKTQARLALAATIILGLAFLVLTYFEVAEQLLTLTPRSSAYGSTFYVIVILHGLHTLLGIFMMTWVFINPRWEPTLRTPHRPYYNVAIYWLFLTVIWAATVGFLYVGPHIYVAV